VVGAVRYDLLVSISTRANSICRLRTLILKANPLAPSLQVAQPIQGTFRPDRIRAIADRFGVDGEAALSNILYGEIKPLLWVQ